MTTLYPGADYRPLGRQTQPPMRAYDIVCLHTMVGSLEGTDVYFRSGGYDGVEAHFGVGHDGAVCQWQDLEHTADANLDGNSRVISIETADTGPGFAKWSDPHVPAWLPAQLDVLTDLVAWLCDRYTIPCALIPDSRPGRRGVGYHRQGIDPWRVPDGERWSSSRGKVCPGDLRIAQMPGLVGAAAALTTPPTTRRDPATREDVDDVLLIPLTFLDATGRPDPAGLNFVASCPIEATKTSQVINRAWVRWVSYFGASTFRIVAWDATGPIAEADPRQDWWELPATVRGITVEGSRAAPAPGRPPVQPSVTLLTTPK